MSDPIIAVSANYICRRISTEVLDIGWSPICPANSSRWSLRITGGRFGTAYVSPFPTNDLSPGILVNAGETFDFYLSRDPALVGLAWYVWLEFLPIPSYWIDVWEQTPVGT